jgi:hypothetical protein
MASIDELLAMPDFTEGTLAECAQRLRDARQARDALTEVVNMLEMELPARMESESVEVPNVGVLRKARVTTSTWSDENAAHDFRERVAQVAIEKIALNVATGELDPVVRNVGRAIVDKLWDYVPSFSTVKAQGKRDGIDVEEYRSFTHSTKVVIDLPTDEVHPWK